MIAKDMVNNNLLLLLRTSKQCANPRSTAGLFARCCCNELEVHLENFEMRVLGNEALDHKI